MNRKEATALLDAELAMVREQTYEDLTRRLSAPAVHVERVGASGTKYQIQIECFWDNRPGGNIRVMGSIDDRGWRAFIPVARDFIKAPDGWFVGE
jgi:hypothetical protein